MIQNIHNDPFTYPHSLRCFLTTAAPLPSLVALLPQQSGSWAPFRARSVAQARSSALGASWPQHDACVLALNWIMPTAVAFLDFLTTSDNDWKSLKTSEEDWKSTNRSKISTRKMDGKGMKRVSDIYRSARVNCIEAKLLSFCPYPGWEMSRNTALELWCSEVGSPNGVAGCTHKYSIM